jgi:hypothetical protein
MKVQRPRPQSSFDGLAAVFLVCAAPDGCCRYFNQGAYDQRTTCGVERTRSSDHKKGSAHTTISVPLPRFVHSWPH